MKNQTKKQIAGVTELVITGIATGVAIVTGFRGKNNLFGNGQKK